MGTSRTVAPIARFYDAIYTLAECYRKTALMLQYTKQVSIYSQDFHYRLKIGNGQALFPLPSTLFLDLKLA